MPSELDIKKRIGRKLTKRRKEGHQVTMEIPEKFKDGDDADEDITAPKGIYMNMNQSVFGMIAAAGSQADFNARFDEQSSEDEETQGDGSTQDDGNESTNTTRPEQAHAPSKLEKHQRKFSENKLLQSLSHLNKKSTKSKPQPAPTGSTAAPESPSAENAVSRRAPVMSQMLQAQEELASKPSFDLPRRPAILENSAGEETTSSILATRLMEIFEFDKPEEVIEGQLPAAMHITMVNIDRIPLLAPAKCIASRIHVHYNQAYLFLRLPAQEICKLSYLSKLASALTALRI